jgi:3D (Asp-Asp-Asp) domain-containing protein
MPALIRAIVALAAILLSACSTPKRSGGEYPKPTLSTKAKENISKTASRRMYVRTTAYHHTEPGGRRTAVGGYLRATHSAATDWSWLPVGTRFRIVETGEDYVVEDYGSALIGRYTIDLYKSTRGAMNAWGVRFVNIEILELGSYKTSMAVLLPRQKWPHVRQMVSGLKKKV